MIPDRIGTPGGEESPPRHTRRRALAVMAATSCLPFVRHAAGESKAAGSPAYRWRGTALSAEATITLHHPRSQRAQHLIELCIAEIERLERIFSLYRSGSELARLNRTGRLDDASPEMGVLLEASNRVASLSGGAFDPTVQPLWHLYAAQAETGRRLPDRRALAAALELIDYRKIGIERHRVQFTGRGMSLTLNGIAQGYMTDRIADILRDAGMDSVLVELGEIIAIGRAAAGNPWRIALACPQGAWLRSHAAAIDLVDAAVATSGAYGTRLDPVLGSHHLFDPRTGACPERLASVSVVARRAMLADALSTALYVEPSLLHTNFLRRVGALGATAIGLDGRVTSIAV